MRSDVKHLDELPKVRVRFRPKGRIHAKASKVYAAKVFTVRAGPAVRHEAHRKHLARFRP